MPDFTIRRQWFSAIFLLALAGGIAAVLMFWITTLGPGIYPDSVTYIETAKSVLDGKGFYSYGKPTTHYPPGYPLLLAAVVWGHGGNILQAGRMLCIVLFAVNVILLGSAVFIATKRSLLAMMCAVCGFLLSAPNISLHSFVMSEAPFITFTLASFILFALHIAKPNPYLLLAASICVGYAMVTRYVGITLIPTITFGLLCFGNRSFWNRIRDAFIAVSTASLPLAAWIIRNHTASGSTTNRTYEFHPFEFSLVRRAINTIYDFILPIEITGWIKLLHMAVFATIGILAVIYLHRKHIFEARSGQVALPGICLMFSVTYVLLVVVSISCFDASTPLDDRILLPAFLTLTVPGVWLFWCFRSTRVGREGQIVWWIFVLAVFLSVSVNSERAVRVARYIHRESQGANSRCWHESKILAEVKSLPHHLKIYSNGPDIIRFILDREATLIPRVTNPFTLTYNRAFNEQIRLVCKEVVEREAVVVYLDKLAWKWWLPSRAALETNYYMPILTVSDDGTIYGIR